MGVSMGKFGLSSALGTLADFLSFTFIFLKIFPLFYAELCAAFIGMVFNFFMQKRFVFQLQRTAHSAFFLSILFSIVVMMVGAYLLTLLATIPFFAANIIMAKVLIMGFKFGLNYFSKRWVFEKKVFRH